MGALIVFGYGPGISHATAERFGREGYCLALVGRNAGSLAEGASRLKASGFDARAPERLLSIADLPNDHECPRRREFASRGSLATGSNSQGCILGCSSRAMP